MAGLSPAFRYRDLRRSSAASVSAIR
jgi:hypothetical protein